MNLSSKGLFLALASLVLVPGPSARAVAPGDPFAYSLTLTVNNPDGSNVSTFQIPEPVTLVVHHTLGDPKGQTCTLALSEHGDGSTFWSDISAAIKAGQVVNVSLTFPQLPGAIGAATVNLNRALSLRRQEAEDCGSGFTSLSDLGLEQVTLGFQALTANETNF